VSRPDTRTGGDGDVDGIGYSAGGGRIIMTGGSGPSGTGQIIDPRTLATVATFHAASGQLFGGSATAPGRSIFAALTYVVSGRTGKAAALDTFNARTGALLATIAVHSGTTPVTAVLSRSGSTLALLGGSGTV